jgi:transposase
MTDEVKAELLRIVEEDPIAYLDEMQERLAMSTNMWVSLKTLSTTLRDDLGWTLGVYSTKALQQDAQERAEYRELMDKLVLNTEQVLWVDETDKSYSASRRRCA